MVNLIKLIIRVLAKQKRLFAYLLISLSISIALIILTSGYLASEYSCDKYLGNYNKTYRIVNNSNNMDNSVAIDSKFYNDLISNFPSIDKVSRFYKASCMLSTDERNIGIKNLVIVDSNFFEIFDYQILKGNEKQLLNTPNKIVLSQSFAHKLFDNDNPVGKIIQINKEELATVTGVFADITKKTHFNTDAVVSLYTKNLPSTGGTYWNNKGKWKIQNFSYYLTVNEFTDISSLEDKINTSYEAPWIGETNLKLQPLSDIYWNNEIKDYSDHANLQLIFLLISVTFLIAIIASINYINLSLSNLKAESKIVGVFKVLGAIRKNMFRYYILSGSIIYGLSFILAILLAYIALPLFNQLLHTHIYLNILFYSKYLFPFIGFITFLFLVMGLYPSLLFSGINPINLFHGNIKGKIKLSSFSRSLVVFQFIIAIVLIASVLLIFKQINYMKNKNPGFDTSYLINQKINYSLTDDNLLNIYSQEILKNPNVLKLSASEGVPFDIHMWNGIEVNNNDVHFLSIDCDTGFLNILGLQIIEGRQLLSSDNNSCVITQKLVKDCGFEEPLKEKISGKQIIGIADNINCESLHNSAQGIMFKLLTKKTSNLTVKISSLNIPNTLAYMKKQWEMLFPDYPFEYNFYDELIAQEYEREQKLSKSISIIAGIAILLCCLGLLGMVLNIVENRNKEIGIRKVNGAKIIEVLGLLNKDFIIWLAIAFIVAFPVSRYFMTKWLQNFAYKTEISWWVFVLAGTITTLVSLITVSWQSWRAARRKPADALRYE